MYFGKVCMRAGTEKEGKSETIPPHNSCMGYVCVGLGGGGRGEVEGRGGERV